MASQILVNARSRGLSVFLAGDTVLVHGARDVSAEARPRHCESLRRIRVRLREHKAMGSATDAVMSAMRLLAPTMNTSS